jgi:hypothetical protein
VVGALRQGMRASQHYDQMRQQPQLQVGEAIETAAVPVSATAVFRSLLLSSCLCCRQTKHSCDGRPGALCCKHTITALQQLSYAGSLCLALPQPNALHSPLCFACCWRQRCTSAGPAGECFSNKHSRACC